ncbi:unnamed protein product [Rotaria sp. Silwood2]|nr:unnamed protein product [Rotaria sp. Silwood2]
MIASPILKSNENKNVEAILGAYQKIKKGMFNSQWLLNPQFSSFLRDSALFRLTSKSIYRLDLPKSFLNGSDYFNDEDCNKLIDSPLGFQCEVLFIHINNRTNLLHLIKKL